MRNFKFTILIMLFLTSSLDADVDIEATEFSKFNKSLYGELSTTEGNIVISPFSISSALLMAYIGSDAETKLEFKNVMGLNKDSLNRIKDNYENLNDLDSEVELKIANSFFSDKEYEFLPSYEDDLDKFFKVEPYSMDFKNKPESARKKINSWVEDRTDDLIKDLIPQGGITEITRGVLVNAIYFNGKWLNKFKKETTLKLDFMKWDGSATSTSFLRSTFETNYFENEQFQALQLPYEDDRFSMTIILPKDKTNVGFSKLESSFDENLLLSITNESKIENVHISIPKFRSEFQIYLRKSLVALGLKSAFDETNANFSRMTKEKGLHISEVIHKAFIEVEEEGTKAAAATSLIMLDGVLARMPEETKTFKADHPFLYLIRDSKTGLVLFMGRLISL